MSGKGWWNSAISGLESRLDTILAEDDQASAKARAAETATDKRTAESASRSRPNSRLQDRLAKAVQKGADSPVVAVAGDTPRPSSDVNAADRAGTSTPSARVEDPSGAVEQVATATVAPGASTPTSSSPAAPSTPVIPLVADQPASMAMLSMPLPTLEVPESVSSRPSLDSSRSRPSVDEPLPSPLVQGPEEVAAELALLQSTYEQTMREDRDEINGHLERIDALQAKLAYLAQQLAATAKATATDPETTSEGQKLAEKDAQIAALMNEGQKLSKTEMKHLATMKKMRAKAQEQDKEIALLKQRLAQAEKGITEQSGRARRAEAAEKSAQDKLKVVGKIEKDIELIRAEREEAGLTISELRKQLEETMSRAEEAERRVQSGALDAEKRATASLKEDMEQLRIEKKLAEDRARRETQAARDEAKDQQEKAKVTELELRGEIANLESKLEFLRSRTEEATSSATGDSQAKLLRQIETLQTQYSLASENWQGIETTLTSRVAALEKDRDEIAKRESDVRRKAREVNSKARRLEDELEATNERARAFEHTLGEQSAAAQKLQARLGQAETAAQDARCALERERTVWETELQQRLEEERTRWKHEVQTPSLREEPNYLRTESHVASQRRHSPDALGSYTRRALSRPLEQPMVFTDRMFEEVSRRPTSSRNKSSGAKVHTPDLGTPQRQNSVASGLSYMNGNGSGGTAETPSVHAMDHDDPFDDLPSPRRTINDMISVSTVGAGPSVQLVERMSAAVRRLESEKASSKEELHRLAAQRDEAREEVVALLREVEAKRGQEAKMAELEKRLADMDGRYQTTLEMLGEKTERVEELEGDVKELKKIYRELVQTMK